MEKIKKPYIDWTATGDNLRLLRSDNITLRKYVFYTLGTAHGDCCGDCDACVFDMDTHISQKELARVMGVTEHMVINWETARSKPRLEHLLMYAKICKLDIFKVVVLANERNKFLERE